MSAVAVPLQSKPRAVALLGPTASGKTALALALAQRFPIEIISLDSALVYRDMDIGTAKPSMAERAAVPHHLIDIISPLQAYSAAQFVSDCTALITQINHRGHLALIVGGTMMYYQALTQGLNALPSADAATRARIAAEREESGTAGLYDRLQALDPVTAARLPPGDTQRIERALEVVYLTGLPLSQHFQAASAAAPALDILAFALIPQDRARLHHAIAARFDQMLEQGLVEEVAMLRRHYPELTSALPSMRCVGYRQVWDYLEGTLDYAAMREHGIIATRQLAKRQLTWLRKLAPQHVLAPWSRQSETYMAEAISTWQAP